MSIWTNITKLFAIVIYIWLLLAVVACDCNQAVCNMEPNFELNSAPKVDIASLNSPNDGCTNISVVWRAADRGRL